jgi:bacillolysin
MAAATASGVDNRGANRTFSAWQDGGQFLLVDTSLPMFDPSSSVPQLDQTRGANFVLTARDAESIESGVFYTISNSSNSWDPDAVAGAHAARESYRFYREVLQRNSLDGQGINLVTIVDVSFNNAFWDPNNKITVYGTSATGASYAQSIDVVGHELTHGVVTFTANLIYQDQSGAMNEAYADIGGSSIEFYSDPSSANWLMGNPADVGKPFRNMQDPESIPIVEGLPHPSRMSQFIVTDQNNGGVHMNCTIPSHAFYLVAEGLPNAVGLRDAQFIFFDALFTKLQPSSKFVDMRLAVVASARQLYGDGSPQHQATVAAFDQVEIFAPDNGQTPAPGTPQAPPPLPTVSGADQGIFSFFDPSWQAAVFAYRDETGAYYLNDANGFPVFANGFVKPGISGNVVIDGFAQQFGVLVTSNNDVYLLDVTTGEGVYLGLQGTIGTAAISRNAAVYGFVFLDAFTGFNLPSLSVIDLANNTSRTFDLLAAHNGFTGGSNSQATILQAGSLEFSPDGEMIFYDAENQILLGGTGFTAWSVYALDYTRTQPAFLSIINPIEGLQIGNMSLGNRFLDRMTFEVAQFSYNFFGQLVDSQSAVYSLNLGTGELGQISNELDTINGLLLPSFTPDDSAIFFTYPFTTADPASSGQFVIAPVDDSGVNVVGNLSFWPALNSVNDGTVIAGALFRTGQYDGLPVLGVRSLVSDVREDAGQVQMFEVTRNGDSSSELPFTFSLTGDGFEPGPIAGAFSPGTSTITFGVRPENNTVDTGSRVLTFSLLPETYLNIDPSQANASVTILDDDTGGGSGGDGEPPYLEATLLNNGWHESAWFGSYISLGDWRWHAEHGWVFLFIDPNGGGMYIYDLGTGRWMWTARNLWGNPSYAYVLLLPDPSKTLSGWFIFYRGGVGDDRWFTELATNQNYQAPSFRL